MAKNKKLRMVTISGLIVPSEWDEDYNIINVTLTTLKGEKYRIINNEKEGDKPYDPSDFGRCYSFVKLCGLTQDDLDKIARKLPYWKPYIDNWEKLTQMFDENEMNNWQKIQRDKIGMFEFMQELRTESDLIRKITTC